MDIRNVFWYLGVFLLLSGLISLLPVLVAIYFGESFIPFLISGIASCIIGKILMLSPKRELSFGDAMLLVATSIMVLSFFGAIPFFMTLQGDPTDVLVNGYFESISAYTTTGLTTLPEYMLDQTFESYHSLIFRRTLSEWLGGLGIIIVFLSVLAKGGISTVYLHRTENSGRRITPSIEHTARITLRIYLFYTFMGAALLWISGLDFFHSVVGVMSVFSTGGFIGSIPSFSSLDWTTELVMMLCMILGAVPFTLHYFLLSGDPGRFFRNTEIRSFFWALSISVLIFMWMLTSTGVADLAVVLNRASIGVVSTMTTTGYNSAELENVGHMEAFMLLILVLIGGCAGSTAGGLKIIRVSVLLKAIQWTIKKYSLPESAIVPFKISGNKFENRELMNISLFFFIYLVLIFFSASVFMLFGTSPINSLFMSASAQGNNSLVSADITTQPLLVRALLIFQMIAGRIEIFPVLALVGFVLKGTTRRIMMAEQVEGEELERRVQFMRKLREIK